MNGTRKVFSTFLAIVLLGSLLGLAFSTSAKQTVSDPKKIEKWVADSKLYEHFITNAVDEGEKSVGSNPDNTVASLGDTALQDAAKSAFSKPDVEANINKFIDSNYDWLEGKTDKPAFVIDLAAAKQSFAQQVGAYVATHSASLPVCTSAEAAQAQAADPINSTCRPANLTPQALGQQVTQQISTSDKFLSNPVLTAQNINPDPASQNKPYFEKFAHLPKIYRFGQKLPYIFTVLSLLSILGLILLSAERRKGWRWMGIIFAVAGIILIAIKFASDMIFNHVEARVFNPASTGDLQHSLTSFAHLIENAAVKIDFIFGLIYLLIALIILLWLRVRNNKVGEVPVAPSVTSNDLNVTDNLKPARNRPRPPGPDKSLQPTRPKRPRLIQ